MTRLAREFTFIHRGWSDVRVYRSEPPDVTHVDPGCAPAMKMMTHRSGQIARDLSLTEAESKGLRSLQFCILTKQQTHSDHRHHPVHHPRFLHPPSSSSRCFPFQHNQPPKVLLFICQCSICQWDLVCSLACIRDDCNLMVLHSDKWRNKRFWLPLRRPKWNIGDLVFVMKGAWSHSEICGLLKTLWPRGSQNLKSTHFPPVKIIDQKNSTLWTQNSVFLAPCGIGVHVCRRASSANIILGPVLCFSWESWVSGKCCTPCYTLSGELLISILLCVVLTDCLFFS